MPTGDRAPGSAADAGADVDVDVESLEQERQFLLRSLADLDAEHVAGDLDDDDYRTLTDQYTARAAAVLRALEAAKVAKRRAKAVGGGAAPAPRPARAGRPASGGAGSGAAAIGSASGGRATGSASAVATNGTAKGAAKGTAKGTATGTAKGAASSNSNRAAPGSRTASTRPADEVRAADDDRADDDRDDNRDDDGRDGRRAAVAASGDSARLAAALRSRRRWRTAAVVIVVVGFVAVASWLVTQSSGSRQPGQTSSGNSQITGTTISGGVDPRIGQAVDDVNKGDVAGALQLFDAVLKDDPNQPVALADGGWLQAQAGLAGNRPDLVDAGLVQIVKAEQVDTSFADAHFFRGFLLLRAKNDPAGAVTELRTYLGMVDPSSPLVANVEALLQEAIKAAGPAVPVGPNAPSTTTGPTAPTTSVP